MDRQFTPDFWQNIFGQNQQPQGPPFGGGQQGPPFGGGFPGGGQQGPPFGGGFPGGGPQGPPFGGGFPGGGPQGPPFGGGFPGGGPQGPPFPTGGGAPTSAPPQFVPQKASSQKLQGQGQFGTFAVDPGAIRPCVRRFIYLWLDNGRSFWAWLTFVGRRSAAGYRWNGFRWVYFGIDLDRIDSFTCF